MGKKEKKPYGYIYRSINSSNEKNYLGQTGTKRWEKDKIPIDKRWNEEVSEANRRNNRGAGLRYIEKAIIKYGPENFKLVEQDTAQNQKELNKKENYWMKEFDSLNPEKGYNVMEAGRGGQLTQRVKDKMSETHEKKWQEDLEYIGKQIEERRERAKNPDWIEKMTSINQNIARNPETLKKMSKSISNKWQEKDYQENVSKGVTGKWQETKFRKRQFNAKIYGKREIPDKREFLKEIQTLNKKDINSKYDMDGKSINKRIEGMLGHHGVKNFSQAKEFLENKNLDKVLKDISERLENQPQQITGKKEISNKREFLVDIQNLTTKEIEQKYDMNRSTATKRIREMLGDKGVKNFTDTKEYLKDKNLDEVVKDINERLSDQSQKFEGKSVIENKREFLEDIQNLQKNEIDHKYRMDAKTINNKIKEMLGEHGVKNYTEAKEFLKDKDLNDVLKEIEERGTEEWGDKSETKEEIEESKEIDRESSEEGDSPEEKDDEIIDEESSEGQVAEPKDPSIGSSPYEPDEPDDQQETQSEKSSDNLSSEPLEKPPRGIILVPLDPTEQEKEKSKEKLTLGQRDKKWESVKLTSGDKFDESGIRTSKDYDGIDQSQIDKGEDFKGIDEYDDADKDYNRLDEGTSESGGEFDGIDSPQEKGDKDYDNIDEGYPEGGAESGGGP